MATKHTPGPLEAIGNLVRTPLHEGGFLVAECRGSDGQPHSAEANANALLFAVSDELLEAAKAAVDWWNAYIESAPQSDLIENAEWGEFFKLRAAIAKAAGEQL